MGNFSDFVGGAAKGAAIGSAIPGLGAIIGGALGGFGELLFGGNEKSPEDIYKERFQEFMNILAQRKREDISSIMKMTSGLMQQATAGAKRRAIGEGLASNSEAFILPAQQRTARIATNAQEDLLNRYRNTELQANLAFLNRPIDIEPSTMDYIFEAGKSAAEYFNLDRYLKALEKSPNYDSTGNQKE